MTIKDIALMIGAVTGIYANLVFQDSLAAGADNDWALKQLNQPSAALLEREQAGRVTLYDGILIDDVDRALDTQFDRIGAMMFVRVLRPQPDGALVEDDDCD